MPTRISSLFFLFLLSSKVFAKPVALEVKDAWARPTIGDGRMSAAYFEVKNVSDKDIRLTGAEIEIGTAEIHESLIENGVMRMHHRPELRIEAGETKSFAPGGLHVMLMGLKQPLETGKSFHMTLKTADHSSVDLTVQIRQP